MPRELSKCREWEKDRRERLKNGFASLCKILPCYEPSISFSKIEILQKAHTYIEELQTQIKDLLEDKSSTKPECATIKKLHDRVKKLMIRNEQLCNLLIDAGIRLPSEYGNVKKFRGTRVWSNKITPDQAKKLLKKEKEIEQKKPKKKVQNKAKKARAGALQKRSLRKIDNTQTITTNLLQSSNFITLVTTQSCFIITNAPSTNANQNCLTKTTTVLTNSNLFSTPLVTSAVKPPLVITKGNGRLNAVSSGTLLVANGSLVPVIQQPTLVPTQTIITNPTPIVVKQAPTSNTTLFVVPKSDVKDISTNNLASPLTSCKRTTRNSKGTTPLKSLPLLRPRIRDLTRTTHVNKVPIPALTSKYAQVSIDQTAKVSKTKSSKSKKKGKSTKSSRLENVSHKKVAEEQNTLVEEEKSGNKDEKQVTKELEVKEIENQNPKNGDKKDVENVEPVSKKAKVDVETTNTVNSDENKKVNIISAYTIDSLCKDVADSTNTETELTNTNKPTTNVEIHKSEAEDKLVEEAAVEKQIEEAAVEKEIEEAKIAPPTPTVAVIEAPNTKETTPTTTTVTTNNSTLENENLVEKDKSKETEKSLDVNNTLGHSDLSNDIFASLSHVATGGGQNPESTSPTAAFLLAFPLVSSLNSLKVTEVIEDEGGDSQHGTPTLLQIGNMDTTKPVQTQSDNLTPNLLNLDNFSFFSKEFCPSFDPIVTSSSSMCPAATISTRSEIKKDFLSFNIDEKKIVEEPRFKEDVKTTIKDIPNKEVPIHSKEIPIPNKEIPIPNKEIPILNKEISIPKKETPIPSQPSVYLNNTKNSVAQNVSIDSACQSTSMFPLSQNSTIVSSSHRRNPSVLGCQNVSANTLCSNPPTISVCQLTAAVPVSRSIGSLSQNSSASLPALCQNSSVSLPAFCQSSVLVCQSAPVLPSISQLPSMMSVSRNSSSIPVCQSQNAIPHLTTYSAGNSMDYSSSYNNSFCNGAQTVTTSSTATMTSAKHQIDKFKVPEKKTCNYYPTTTSYSVPQYNTFNPFTDIPKSTTYPISTKAYNDSLYTNNTSYSYNYHSDNFVPSYPTSKSNIKPDKLYYGLNYDNYEYKHNEFQKYDTRNQQFGNYYNQNQVQNKEKTNTEVLNKNSLNASASSKVPVNWMTTPDVRQQHQNDFIVPSLGKDMDFAPNPVYSSNSFNAPPTTYFNTNTNPYSSNELHNTAPFPTIPTNSFQRNDLEENQFSWSPSKLPQLLDTTHNFVSGTLPTLVGDLALGNTQPFVEQKIENKNTKDYRMKENARRSKPQTNYDSQSNFLSVSQLVDHNKNEAMPNKVSSRRNSGNRSSNKASSSTKGSKRMSKSDKEMHNFNNNKVADKQIKHSSNHEYQTQSSDNSNWMATNKSRNIKMPSNNYSAEALIGHHNQTDLNRSRSSQNYPMVNKSLPVPFLTDNIIPYFPMDIPQENSLTQQNQNYQSNTFGHNFSSGIQGGVYSNASFVPNAVPITTSYLPPTNFIPEIGGNPDYTPILPENTFTMNRTTDKYTKHKPLQNEKHNEKRNAPQQNVNCNLNTVNLNKKHKKKQHNEPNLSNFDFSFLSMPAAINSPILPDDFHAHSNFLPPPTPTQLYPCKNPLYGKQDLTTNSLLPIPTVSRGGVAHPEVSPSLNNVGTALTNFNLSTIFPEINKVSGPMSDIYSDNGKAKDYNQREFLVGTSHVS